MTVRARPALAAVLVAGLLGGPSQVPPAAAATAVPSAATAVPSAATAADPSDRKAGVDRQIDRLREALEDTSRDLAEAYLALRRTEAGLPAARQALASATARVVTAQRHHEEVVQQLLVAQATETRAAEQLLANAAATQAAERRLGNIAAETYQSGGLTALNIALDPRSPSDFADRMSLVDTVMGLQAAALRDLSARQAEGAAQQAYLVAVRQQVAGLEAAAAKALTAAQQARTAAAAAKAQLDALVAQQRAHAATVARTKAGEAARLRALQAESAQLGRLLAARAAAARAAAARAAARTPSRRTRGDSPPPAAGGVLAYPVSSAITSEFGLRLHPILGYYRLHAGADFAASCGTPVYAAGSGRVIRAGWSGGYGNQVVIDHGLVRGVGLATTYNHLSRIVRSGGSVSRGQLIAYAGTTGLSTGCHLHFETWENGTPVNPRRWL